MTRHAIVIGASMAGLMAAKVLADRFDQVTLIERDTLADGPEPRKGVPQAFHAHTLLIRGKQILESLFPGLGEDLAVHGAVHSDSSAQIKWFQHGVWKGRSPSGLIATSMTRPLLEWRVRTHLLKLPNVTLLEGTRVLGLLATDGAERITGVHLEPTDHSEPARRLAADLVVDASGRGTRAPQWLEELGYGQVQLTEIKTGVAYASRLYRYHGPKPDFNMCIVMDQAPGTRVGVLFRVEQDRWLLTLQTMLGDAAPTDDEGFLAFARSLPQPEIAEFLRTAEPVSDILAHKTPTNLRRHYEQMDAFPDGLVILGDACTSFNPRYGQGMTTAALGAGALQTCLAAGGPEQKGWALRFQRELAKAIATPWQASTGEDLAYPQVEGKRGPESGLINWYMRRVVRLTSIDREALVAFLSVVHLLKPVTALFAPRILWKVLTVAGGIR
ncbi:MAG TPA: FAD-dependent oxidoreductase [Symbiobacteriaceae bacterium]|nr:FAD-dependent oxidoreductase [Symbiobacteriaceae bacterium]